MQERIEWCLLFISPATIEAVGWRFARLSLLTQNITETFHTFPDAAELIFRLPIMPRNIDIVNLLMEEGADVNAQGYYFGSARCKTASVGRSPLIQL